jgi:hypothetical protein
MALEFINKNRPQAQGEKLPRVIKEGELSNKTKTAIPSN